MQNKQLFAFSYDVLKGFCKCFEIKKYIKFTLKFELFVFRKKGVVG